MRILYLDCGMGAAGDMLLSALLSLLKESEQKAFVCEMNQIGIPGAELALRSDSKCGVQGLHISVKIHGQEEGDQSDHRSQDAHSHHHAAHSHHHAAMEEIVNIIRGLAVSERVKRQVTEIYQSIAQAESEVHGTTVSEVHFHEVGMMDALADITGCALLLERLEVDRILASPVKVGFGQVRCAHGVLPVPAPATALLLKEIPCYAGDIEGELCTPTGAALLRYYVREFCRMPPMRIRAAGYGTGKKDLPAANVVRALLGETEEETGQILELCCNLDDMTGEEIGYAMEKLLDLGALEVFTVPISMKKSRPGVLLSVFCLEEEKEKFAACLFRHTSTIGIRERVWERMKLHRREQIFESSIGRVRVKTSSGFGVEKRKAEYEDLREIAETHDMTIRQVRDIVRGEM